MIDPKDVELPTVIEEPKHTPWVELFKYPRSMIVSVLTEASARPAASAS